MRVEAVEIQGPICFAGVLICKNLQKPAKSCKNLQNWESDRVIGTNGFHHLGTDRITQDETNCRAVKVSERKWKHVE
jgi:hypothetical protein